MSTKTSPPEEQADIEQLAREIHEAIDQGQRALL